MCRHGRRPVQEKQCAQRGSVAEQQRTDTVQHGEELHQPGHSQDGAPPFHTVTQHSTHIQHWNTLRDQEGFLNLIKTANINLLYVPLLIWTKKRKRFPREIHFKQAITNKHYVVLLTLLRRAIAAFCISLDGFSDVW